MSKGESYKLEFNAEIGAISSRKLVSLDREHKVTFHTPESSVLELAVLDPNTVVKVTVELQQ